MNEHSKPGTEPGGGRKEEGIAALGRKVVGIDVGSKGIGCALRRGKGKDGKCRCSEPPPRS